MDRIPNAIADLHDKLVADATDRVKNGLGELFDGSDDEDIDEDEDDEEFDDSDEDDDDEGLEDDPEDDDLDDEDMPGMAWDGPISEDNLAAAVGAWRAAGCSEHVVAFDQSSGAAFFGTQEQLNEYLEDQGLTADGWAFYDDAAEILDLEFNPDVLISVASGEATDLDSDVAQMYRDAHWGQDPNVLVHTSLPDVTVPTYFFGRAESLSVCEPGEEDYSCDIDLTRQHFPSMQVPADGSWYLVQTPAAAFLRALRARALYDVSIPGISCALARIGQVSWIDYYAKKGNKPIHFEHEHGEATGVLPDLLVPPHGNWVLVQGGRMKVEDRGITD